VNQGTDIDMPGRWLFGDPSETMFGDIYLTRSDDGDPAATILHVRTDGTGFVANARGNETGKWWATHVALHPGLGDWARRFDGITPILKLDRSFDAARGSVYYFGVFVASFEIGDDGNMANLTRVLAA
jgi:hypothetical protein